MLLVLNTECVPHIFSYFMIFQVAYFEIIKIFCFTVQILHFSMTIPCSFSNRYFLVNHLMYRTFCSEHFFIYIPILIN